MSNEVWDEIYEKLEELIRVHKTTLIFVNTRRLSERMTHNLTERFGANVIAAHHGSISKELRLDAEKRLKSGELKAIIATASLELGIDIGAVDLVCQIGSPKSIATFLQRVGRSGHTVKGMPRGKIFQPGRAMECAALFDAAKTRGARQHNHARKLPDCASAADSRRGIVRGAARRRALPIACESLSV
jgi:ATP-dependent Lhr-like helicase